MHLGAVTCGRVQESTKVRFAANLMYAKATPVDLPDRPFCFQVQSALKYAARRTRVSVAVAVLSAARPAPPVACWWGRS